MDATTLQAVTLFIATAQSCFMAWLGGRVSDLKQRNIELQAQVQDLQDRAHSV